MSLEADSDANVSCAPEAEGLGTGISAHYARERCATITSRRSATCQ
jgi:hypothetical protein